MNSRDRQSLDNYITGHYGEDQFQRSEFWPYSSVHQEYAQRHILHDVYEYDPADDGPEVETIKAILSMHGEALLLSEHSAYLFSRRRRKVSYAR